MAHKHNRGLGIVQPQSNGNSHEFMVIRFKFGAVFREFLFWLQSGVINRQFLCG